LLSKTLRRPGPEVVPSKAPERQVSLAQALSSGGLLDVRGVF